MFLIPIFNFSLATAMLLYCLHVYTYSWSVFNITLVNSRNVSGKISLLKIYVVLYLDYMTVLFNMKITSVCCHLSIVLRFEMRILLSFMFVLFYSLFFLCQ